MPRLFGSAFYLFIAAVVLSASAVTTSQYDNLRTGATLTERILTPANVRGAQFGKIGSFHVDGAVYAQPLFVPALEIPGKGRHDVIFVATEHDSVYAFDAAQPAAPPLWRVSFLDESSGTTPVPSRAVQCPFLRPEIGITSTPVIDLESGTLFVLARTAKGNQFFQHLHALSIATGTERFGGPTRITASAPGNGAGSLNGAVSFEPLRENPRAALLLAGGHIVLTWGSSCDQDPYHGWIMTYDAKTLKQTAVFNVTPDGSEGGIWTSDTGLGADRAGNIFVPTGNGTFTAGSGGRDYGNSLLKVSIANGAFAVRDYFTPHNQEELSASDLDLGSGGPLLVPDQPGPHPRLLLQPTKAGVIYVFDRDRLGKHQRGRDDVLQAISLTGDSYGAMAYWHGHVYFASSDDYLRDYRVADGRLSLNAASKEPKFDNPGATPSISADGDRNAIVWAVSTRTWNGAERPAILYAFDAADISRPIYTSEQNSARDRAGLAARFVIPVVANGRVYFGTRDAVEVYGLLR